MFEEQNYVRNIPFNYRKHTFQSLYLKSSGCIFEFIKFMPLSEYGGLYCSGMGEVKQEHIHFNFSMMLLAWKHFRVEVTPGEEWGTPLWRIIKKHCRQVLVSLQLPKLVEIIVLTRMTRRIFIISSIFAMEQTFLRTNTKVLMVINLPGIYESDWLIGEVMCIPCGNDNQYQRYSYERTMIKELSRWDKSLANRHGCSNEVLLVGLIFFQNLRKKWPWMGLKFQNSQIFPNQHPTIGTYLIGEMWLFFLASD